MAQQAQSKTGWARDSGAERMCRAAGVAAHLAGAVAAHTSRPVIGIPWSDETAAYFAAIGVGTSFQITMNTGAILTYTFEDKREVRRSETGIFRQVSPGLALLLLGETDEEGFPTA